MFYFYRSQASLTYNLFPGSFRLPQSGRTDPSFDKVEGGQLLVGVLAIVKYYVYVLKSRKNGKKYAGFTRKNPVARLNEHNRGVNTWTRYNGPFDLFHVENFSSRKEALKRELYFKSAAGRKHLNKLIPG